MSTLRRMGSHALSVSLLVGAIIGCGGNNGVPSASVGSGNGRSIHLFVTDSFREDVDQVLLTVAKVELIAEDGSVVVAYDDPIGHQFDAKSLRDSVGQLYNFVVSSTVPSRIYSAVRLTLADGFTIVPKDQLLTKTLAVDESFPKDSQGRPQIQYALATPRDVSAGDGVLVIDVDLAGFRYNGAAIVPSFVDGARDGLNDLRRQQNDEYRGRVANLTGDRFELVLGNTRLLPVTVAPDAVVFGAATALAMGQTIEAVGKLDVTSGRFVASEIRTVAEDAGEIEPARPQVNGTVQESRVAADRGTITLQTARIKGFRPLQATIEVQTASDSTQFIARDGSTISPATFYDALSRSPRIYVEGQVDADTNVLIASLAKLE